MKRISWSVTSRFAALLTFSAFAFGCSDSRSGGWTEVIGVESQAAGCIGEPWTLGGVATCLIGNPPANAPVSPGICPGVRPGALVLMDGTSCTLNFLFEGADGNRYIGTAGHCIVDSGEQRWARGAGPEAQDSDGRRIGEFAYAILEDPKDFALIRLDRDIDADPQMCYFGGPTGINTDQPTSQVVLQHYGNGLAIGAVVPARTALAMGMPDPDHVRAYGAVVFGDSGSGIISDDGRAVGVVVTVGFGVDPEYGTSGDVGITRLQPQVDQAGRVLGTALEIVTAAKVM